MEKSAPLQVRVEELEHENSVLRDFAWAASHDLKEPLRGIVLQLELLANSLDGKPDGKQVEYLQLALKSAQVLTAMLPAVEHYIRIQTEELELSTVDCNSVVENAVGLLRTSILEARGSVTWSPLPALRTSESLLMHVFLNLIQNAVRYRSPGPPRVEIACDFKNGEWHFLVSDNGIGIDPKFKDYIFEPFGRLHSHRTSGSGMGLALCRAAVTRLGGRIWVEAAENGGGSVFRFSLPYET